MTPSSSIDTVNPPEDSVFNHDEAINELRTNEIAEPIQVEAPTYPSEINTEGDGPKPEKRFKINKAMVIGGAALLAAILTGAAVFGGIKSSNKNNNAGGETGIGNEPTEDSSAVETDNTTAATIDSESSTVTLASGENTAQTTVAETTVETDSGTQVDYSRPPENVVEGYSFDKLTPTQQEDLKTLEYMPIAEFQALSQDEQSKYTDWLLVNNKPRFDRVLEKSGISLTYYENATTAEQFVANRIYLTAFASGLETYDPENPDAGLLFDRDNAKKFLATELYTSTIEHQKGANEFIDRMSDSTLRIMGMSVDESKVVNGETIINITCKSTPSVEIEPGNEHVQMTYSDFTFTTYDGTEKTIYLCSLATNPSSSNYIDIIS